MDLWLSCSEIHPNRLAILGHVLPVVCRGLLAGSAIALVVMGDAGRALRRQTWLAVGLAL